jgi:hypothetical protein
MSKLVFWKADNFLAFLAERLMLSIVLSGLSGCDSAFLYANMGNKNPKKVYAIYSFMGTAGLLFAAVMFSLFLYSKIRQTAFFTFIAYAIAFLLSLFLSGKAEGTEKRVREAIAPRELFLAVFSDKRFLCYLVACAFLMETSQTITVFLRQLQYQRCGIPIQLYGYLNLLLTGAGMFAMGAATLGKKLKEKGLMFVVGIACLMLYASNLAILSASGIIAIRIASSLLYPLLEDAKNRQVQHANRATVLSGYSMLMSLTGVFTNLVFGWLSDLDISYAMLFGMVLNVTGYIMVRQAYRSKLGKSV